MNKKTEQPVSRYIFTLLSTIGRIALTVITSVLVPNALGPKSMGIIAYGQVIAQNLRGLFDFNLSSTFFNLSSEKEQSGSVTRILVKIILIQVIVSMLILTILFFNKYGINFIKGISYHILLILLLIEWFLFLTNLSNQLGDTKSISKWPQLLILLSNLFMTVFVIVLNFIHKLNIDSYLIITLLFGFLNFISIIYYLFKNHHDQIWAKIEETNIKNFLKVASKISLPLTIASYYTMSIEFLERYIIQYKYGAEEQSYYYIALKWTGIVIILISSSLQIFWQALVKKFSDGDIQGASKLYLRIDSIGFYLVLTFAIIWSFLGKALLSILLGKDFANAGSLLVVMSFYPISQVFGQMGTTIAIASGRSNTYLKSTLITSTIGLLISYILLMPKNSSIPGMGLGSLGLAIKTAIYGLFATQLITFLNCQYFSISYFKLLLNKIKITIVLVFILYLCSFLLELIQPFNESIYSILLKAILFFILSGIFLLKKPIFCGVSQQDIDKVLERPILSKTIGFIKNL